MNLSNMYGMPNKFKCRNQGWRPKEVDDNTMIKMNKIDGCMKYKWKIALLHNLQTEVSAN